MVRLTREGWTIEKSVWLEEWNRDMQAGGPEAVHTPRDPGSVAGATERSSVWPSVTRQMGVQGLHLVLILRNCWARLLAVCSEGRGVRWDQGVILEA